MIDEKFLKIAQKESNNKEALSLMFIRACIDGHLDKVRYLLTSPNLKEHAQISHNKYQGFLESCERGDFEVVKYLLSSPEINEHADINANDGQALVLAINSENKEIVDYLLTSKELKYNANINCDGYYGIYCACYNGSFDLVKYLFTNDRTKEQILEPNSIRQAVKGCLDSEQTEILKYLIFEVNIEKSKYIDQILDFYKNQRDFSETVKNMFTVRGLMADLQEFPTNELAENKKKAKI